MYKHGVGVLEAPTKVVSVVESSAGLPIVIGLAPINLAKEPSVNEAKLIYSNKEAVNYFGFSRNFKDYTLSEATDAAFNLFGVAPIVMVNVLDPEKHVTETTETIAITNKKAKISTEGVLLSELKLSVVGEASTELVRDTDYLVEFDSNGYVSVILLEGSHSELTAKYKKLDPSKVTKLDIIGGIDVNDGSVKGLENINKVFPKYGLVPGTVLAPGYTHDPVVESVLKSKVNNINSYFRATAIVDVDTKEVNTYSKVTEWKNKNNYTSPEEIVCWPEVAIGEQQYRLSTQLACLIAQTDGRAGDIPYVSPSNKSLQMNKAILNNGTEVELGPDEAEYLNSQGITTALNFIGGWKAWGNRTGAFPANTDVKDAFVAVRRMQKWIGNTLILTHWQKVDNPTIQRQIDGVVDTTNIWLNGLESAGALLGAHVDFRSSDNPITDLLAGITRYHVSYAAPVPNEYIEFILEYDPSYLNTLFE
ncbi:phage tail sheath family protein [Viridibacillus arvi]|uniref:phage tail sheath family protein n=1 Tax=Viridibacillus arvi TaxID=263475 RepID=UPI0034CDEEAB